jgi:hypothetical protein
MAENAENAENALVKKLKLKAGQRIAIVGAPDGYRSELQPLPDGVEVSETLTGTFDWIQVFVRNRAELEAALPKLVAALRPVSLLWVSFPKGSSKIQTDLTRDTGWDLLESPDLKRITLIAVDSTWSAFSFRPYKPGEARPS